MSEKQKGKEVAFIDQSPDGTQSVTVFQNEQSFIAAQRMAQVLVSSNIVPKEYQGKENLPNAIVALEVAQRIGASPLMVMQNLDIIYGRPSWRSQFIIAAINSTKRFSPVRFDLSRSDTEETVKTELIEYQWENGKKKKVFVKVSETINDVVCIAWAYDKKTAERLEGPPVSLKMAILEGWFTKSGSKWKTMPELMLRYRAAAFFGRLYAPEVLMGMYTADEQEDIGPASPTPEEKLSKATETTANKGDVIDLTEETGGKQDVAPTEDTGKDKETPTTQKGWPKWIEKEYPEICADGVDLDALHYFMEERLPILKGKIMDTRHGKLNEYVSSKIVDLEEQIDTGAKTEGPAFG